MNSNTELSSETLTALLHEEEIDSSIVSKLVVYNDDYNTFDWVIQCFMQVCNHTFEQAEQLSLIIHFRGKATVKTASIDVLKPMKDSLIERGLSAVIESLVED